MFQRSEEGPRLHKCTHPRGTPTCNSRGDAGLIFSGYPEAMGFITVSFIMDRKTFDSPRASCFITGSLLIKHS